MRAASFRHAFILIALSATLAPRLSSAEPVVLITNRANAVGELTIDQLRRVYLGKRTRLSGQRVYRFHFSVGDPIRDSFSRTVIRKTDIQLEDYWIEQALTGGAIPPQEFASSDEIIDAVGTTPYSIGYTRLSDADDPRVIILGIEFRDGVIRHDADEYPIRTPD